MKSTIFRAPVHLLPLLAAAANAQNLDESAAASPVITEIIVTAELREESVMSVPVAMTVVGEDRLSDYGAGRVADLQYLVPNLVITQDKPSSAGVFIRGVGNDTRNVGLDMRAGVYLDGVHLGRSQAVNLETLGLRRVEVLRGPQGTLFGKNTVSGAINLVTALPEEYFSGRVFSTLGERDQVIAGAQLNVPLNDDGLYSLWEVVKKRKEGPVHNRHTGSDLNGTDSLSARMKLRYRPGNNLDAVLSLDWFDEDTPAVYRQAQSASKFVVNHDTIETDARTAEGAALTLNYTLPGEYLLTSISAYRESGYQSLFDEDYSPLYIALAEFNEDHRQFSQELRLSSPLYERYDYLAGLYFEDIATSSEREASLGPDATGGPILPVNSAGSVDNRAWAVYAHGNYRIAPRMEATGGLRYTQEDKSFRFAQTDRSGLFITLPEQYRDEAGFEELSGNLGLNYHLHEAAMVYGKYATGFKSGGWNADYISTVEQLPFKPEYVDSLEAGLKSSFLDEALELELAVFHARYEDFQVQQFSTDSSGATIIVVSNAGEVTSRGVEAELRAAFDNLAVSLNAGIHDTEYDEYKDANGPGVDLDGERLGTPRGSVNLLVSWLYGAWRPAELISTLEYSHRLSAGNKGPLYPVDSTIPSYGILNAQIAVDFRNNGLQLEFWGRNIGDKTYLVARDLSFLGIPRRLFGEERTFGITASYEF